jgi:CRISPR type IV-associated protein Csf3
MIFKVTFTLDGSGVYYDANEPIHLDALLAWVLAPKQGFRHVTRDDEPAIIELPLKRKHYGEHWVWCASALFPVGPTGEDLQFWRKRFRASRAELTSGSPNLTNGTFREWNQPVPLLLCTRLVAWGNGDASAVRKALREVTHLGKKRAHGYGKITNCTVESCDNDYSIYNKDGCANRFIPDPRGTRKVRPIPPYWNQHGSIHCLDPNSTAHAAELVRAYTTGVDLLELCAQKLDKHATNT